MSDRPNTRRRLLTALATLLVAVLALSGCAAGKSADEPTSGSSPSASSSTAPDFRDASVRARLTATCNREAHAFLGGDLTDRRLNRLQVVWFAPTQQELSEGARWMRCDVLALGRSDSLMPLPRL